MRPRLYGYFLFVDFEALLLGLPEAHMVRSWLYGYFLFVDFEALPLVLLGAHMVRSLLYGCFLFVAFGRCSLCCWELSECVHGSSATSCPLFLRRCSLGCWELTACAHGCIFVFELFWVSF